MTKLAKEWELQSDDNALAYRQKVTELQQALAKIAELKAELLEIILESKTAYENLLERTEKAEKERNTAIKAVEELTQELDGIITQQPICDAYVGKGKVYSKEQFLNMELAKKLKAKYLKPVQKGQDDGT